MADDRTDDKEKNAADQNNAEDQKEGQEPVTEPAIANEEPQASSKASVASQSDNSFLAEPPKKPSKALALLALLIALIAAGAAGYIGWEWYNNQESERQQQQLVAEHQKQLSQLRTAVETMSGDYSEKLASRDQQINSLQRMISESEQKIDAYARRLQTLTATTTDDWRLAEVEYLLGLANQRILTSKDVSTAVNLLETADSILLELADPRLFDIRKAVASDKAALQAVGKQDIDGAFLELAALSQQVASLQVLVMPEFTPQETTAIDNSNGESTRPAWLQKVLSIGSATWREVKALVVVQRADEPVEPLLPPEQQFYLKSNLRLLLGKAQLALLDGRQQVYTSSLSTASQWVQSYFPQQFAANQAMYDALVRLESLVVEQDYPDVSISLLAVRAFIAEQHQLQGANGSEAKQGTE